MHNLGFWSDVVGNALDFWNVHSQLESLSHDRDFLICHGSTWNSNWLLHADNLGFGIDCDPGFVIDDDLGLVIDDDPGFGIDCDPGFVIDDDPGFGIVDELGYGIGDDLDFGIATFFYYSKEPLQVVP